MPQVYLLLPPFGLNFFTPLLLSSASSVSSSLENSPASIPTSSWIASSSVSNSSCSSSNKTLLLNISLIAKYLLKVFENLHICLQNFLANPVHKLPCGFFPWFRDVLHRIWNVKPFPKLSEHSSRFNHFNSFYKYLVSRVCFQSSCCTFVYWLSKFGSVPWQPLHQDAYCCYAIDTLGHCLRSEQSWM